MSIAFFILLFAVAAESRVGKCSQAHRPFGDMFESPGLPETIIESLAAIQAGKPDPDTNHPDRLTRDQFPHLKSRHIVYLDTQAVPIPGLNGKTAEFVILNNRETELDIFNQHTGILTLKSDLLAGHIYVKRNFAKRSPYLPGEIVKIGQDKDNVVITGVDQATMQPTEIPAELQPVPAQFVGVRDMQNYLIRFPGNNGKPVTIAISPEHIRRLGLGTGLDLQRALRKVPHSPPQVDEIVRFRLPNGAMTRGRVLLVENEVARVQSTSGVFNISIHRLFRHFGPRNPRSIGFSKESYVGLAMDLEAPRGLVEKFLDGAARLMSSAEIKDLPVQTQIEALLNYQHLLMPWSLAAAQLETVGFTKMSEAVCSGAGVCRHKVPLMAAILSEAGFEVRIKARAAAANEPTNDPNATSFNGHTWLEVDVPVGRLSQTLIVDPSNGRISTIERAAWEARHFTQTMESSWYAHPDSQTVPFRYLSPEMDPSRSPR